MSTVGTWVIGRANVLIRKRKWALGKQENSWTGRPNYCGEQGSEPLLKPWISLQLEGQQGSFQVDAGTDHFVLKIPLGLLPDKQTLVQEAIGPMDPWATKQTIDLIVSFPIPLWLLLSVPTRYWSRTYWPKQRSTYISLGWRWCSP